MSEPGSAPATYQQWLDALSELKTQPFDAERLSRLSTGTLPGRCSPMMVSHISDTVRVLLSRQCRDLLHRMDLALAEGDLDQLRLSVIRFRGRVLACLFYRRLRFLSQEDRQILEDGFTRQVLDFWKDLLQQMERDARRGGSPLLEEGLYVLKRMKILT